MENRIHQRRVSFSDTQSPKHHLSSGSRNDNAWNWLQSIAFHDDDMGDDKHVTLVAAAAFAIHSLEEAELHDLQKMREVPKSSRTQTMRGKEDNMSRRPSCGEISIKMSFGQDPRTKVIALPVRRPSDTPSPRSVSSKIQAKHQMERKKRALEHRRAMENQSYCNKIAREDMIAQLEDKRRKQESKARGKANKIQKTGKVL